MRENMKPQKGKHETLNDIAYWLLVPLILRHMWHVEPFKNVYVLPSVIFNYSVW